MYVPDAFAVAEVEPLAALIAAYDFATLVSLTPDGLTATHVPVLYEPGRGPRGTLVAHLARTNPHAAALDNAEVLTVFQGPHGYISPTLYAAQPSVPTWNYAAVHAYGRARTVTEPQALRAMLQCLIDKHEAGRAAPWSMDGLPAAYIERMLKGIVGIEIEVARLEGKHKLSQNRSRVDRAQVIAALAASPYAHERDLAAYMQRHAPPPD